MMDDLTVVGVEIGQIRDGVQSFDTGDIPKIADLKATVRNNSSSRTLHVSTLLGGYDYDVAAQRLNITFREPHPTVSFRLSPFTPPVQTTVLPGETKVLEFTIPLTARIIRGFGERAPGVKAIDATGVKEVVATFVYGVAPLRQSSPLPQAGLRRATQTSLPIEPPPKPYPAQRTDE
jgi:hypothetical protein